MQILLFTGDLAPAILDGTKTMTARCWRKKPFKAGEVVRAQSNYSKESTFATLRIKEVTEWDGNAFNIEPLIAIKEGFRKVSEFASVWYSTNFEKLDDESGIYKYYFFEFEIVKE